MPQLAEFIPGHDERIVRVIRIDEPVSPLIPRRGDVLRLRFRSVIRRDGNRRGDNGEQWNQERDRHDDSTFLMFSEIFKHPFRDARVYGDSVTRHAKPDA